jgi:nucleotide-binding universal stress UspA family protein
MEPGERLLSAPSLEERVTFIVPFDGTEGSRWGLIRAVELAPPQMRVVAFAVIPRQNRDWARNRGLLDADEDFQYERIVGRLQDQAHAVEDDVTFQHKTVDRYAPTGKISHEIRSFARDIEATVVVIGSRDAGGIVNSLQSVGSSVASDESYDVVLVRRFQPLAE